VEVNPMTLRDEGRLHKKAKKGARAYPVATIAFYGLDDRRATKVAAAVIEHEGEAASELRRWTTDVGDPRKDAGVLAEVTRVPEVAGRALGWHDRPDHRLPARGRRGLSRRRGVSGLPVLGWAGPMDRSASGLRRR
jgi:hypothetical protein